MTPNCFSVIITPDEAGQRLDKVLAQRQPDLSRARLQALIKSGNVTSAKKPVDDASLKVKPGQEFSITVPAAAPSKVAAEKIALDVVYEDRDVLVLNKPAGMVVHPAAGNASKTLVNALLAHCGDSLSGIGGEKRPGIVHRIDKDTSGLLVIAKNDAAHQGLSAQFSAHTIHRIYYCLVAGRPNPKHGRIETQIGRSKTNRKKMAVLKSGGKKAVTHYRIVESFGDTASLVECKLETGRTHQIRVHMTHIGYPLLGDQTYGKAQRGLPDWAKNFPRQALHAATLGFNHPISGKYLEFRADFPADMQKIVEKFKDMP